ncbi:MAG: hypothetical protein D3923_07205 [Candidatus Electrothrix sp. AR3]|nr:hypothetical protein [Candidatus Electrothrix sp. AR3]
MVKKRVKKNRKKNNNIKNLSVNELPNVGKNYLTQGNFAEAIKVFRRLVQETEEQQWAELLLSSFQGRINQLISKEMHKEALVISSNMQTFFPGQDIGLYIFLLVQSKQLNKALQHYEVAGDTLTGEQKQIVDETFAALLLSGQDKLLQKITPDSPLCVQFPAAQKALRYYTQGHDSEVLECLQQIPFRSPYKNFRMALKGMLVFHDRKDKARSFFDKIDVNSPFKILVSPYLQLIEKEEWNENSVAEKKVIQQLQGLDKAKLKFISSLNKNCTTPTGFLKFLLTAATAGTYLDSLQIRHLCYRLLAYDPSYIRMYEKKFGPIKDEFEYARLKSLAMEIKNAMHSIIIWQETCNILIERKNSSDSLKIALLHRHIAELMGKEYGVREQREELEKSLVYDPNDKETWLTMHKLLQPKKNEQYRWVNKMLDNFPDDPDVLFLGVEAAVQRSAFKKASGLAGKLLKIDPINQKVRKLLVGAHIKHAHKLAKQKKYVLACKECMHASTFDRENSGLGRIDITHGLLQLLQGKEEDGQSLLANGKSMYENQKFARFLVCMEAEFLDMPKEWKKKFTTELKAIIGKKPEKNTLQKLLPA